jgi:hypothetical protein
MSLYMEKILVVYDVPLNVIIIGSPIKLPSFLNNISTYHRSCHISLVILLKIFSKTFFTVFANAPPSLLTYHVSPAYCLPLLISVLWSLFYIRRSNGCITGSHKNSPELIGTPAAGKTIDIVLFYFFLCRHLIVKYVASRK